ncbi:Nif11 domain-containing protein [Hyphomicrobium sp. 1Nfss2.1]|jgi:hypothetical protein|uniref:Nif11-like leader peptide family natural product precursor n=1 Tax=Hyphomicrobium sp. 1Nfss2.1 TaxID=3413936 RepID=UPI003C79A610
MLEKALQRDAESRPFEREMKAFGEILLGDPALLDKLDATPDKKAFIDAYLAMAKERGIHFSREDLMIAVQEQKQGQDWILPRKVIRMIADRF